MIVLILAFVVATKVEMNFSEGILDARKESCIPLIFPMVMMVVVMVIV